MTKLFAKVARDMSALDAENDKERQQQSIGCRIGQIDCNDSDKGNSLYKSQDLIKINQLIDLTDRPISLERDEICWSNVRTSASNCICCCCNGSLTLVTTDESYVLDQIPLDNIETGQANSSLQYLALANDKQLVVLDLIENCLCCHVVSRTVANDQHLHRERRSCKRLIDLDSIGLTMQDIIFWRWVDEVTLALVSAEALFVCRIDEIHIGHPATTALNRLPTQYLSLERVCDLHVDLTGHCQISDVSRDPSGNLYAITGICQLRPVDPKSGHHLRYVAKLVPTFNTSRRHREINNSLKVPNPMSKLKHNSRSVPGHLSSMVCDYERHQQPTVTKLSNFSSIDSLRRISSSKLPQLDSLLKSSCSQTTVTGLECREEIRGATQIYCRLRDRTQVIQAHAVAFTTISTLDCSDTGSCESSSVKTVDRDSMDEIAPSWTTLVAASRVEDVIKVYFIGMATTADLTTSGQNTSRSLEFSSYYDDKMDFPIKVVCTKLDSTNDRTHAAMIVTKFGHLIVCSIKQSSILFSVHVHHDPISDAVLEDKSRGVMLISENGRVLLVKIREDKFCQILDEKRTFRHSLPQNYTSDSIKRQLLPEFAPTLEIDSIGSDSPSLAKSPPAESVDSDSINSGIEILISTKL